MAFQSALALTICMATSMPVVVQLAYFLSTDCVSKECDAMRRRENPAFRPIFKSFYESGCD
jgi:hypothetical protein